MACFVCLLFTANNSRDMLKEAKGILILERRLNESIKYCES